MIKYYGYHLFTLLAFLALAGLVYRQLPRAENNAKRIAIFIPAVHPAMDEIEAGFKTAVEKGGSQAYAFTTYNANGNKTLLRAQAEEIAQQNYDLIFTIGTACTHTLHTVTTKKGITTPVVFTAIDDPVKLGIVQTLDSSQNHLTGCTVQDDFENQFKALLEVKPETKHVLFVYDPSDGANRDDLVNTLRTTLNRMQISLATVQVFAAHEIQQKVVPFIESCDVVFIYTDHTTVSGIDSLITLCNRFGKTLFASDLSSGQKGAALAYGVQEADHGTCAAHKGLKILDDGIVPAQIPVTPISTQRLVINTKTMRQQGLKGSAQ
jgi:putative ABC transport system substrate-binding protein